MLVAPSLLAANFLDLGSEIKMIDKSEADWLHLDVMDGRFVPNISFGLPVIQQLRKVSKKPFDVHLMIEEPEKYAEAFKNAGADHITVHYETCRHLNRNIQQIKSLGMKAGVAINPHTPVSLLVDIVGDVDQILIMSVNPGFGGQEFIPHTYQKIHELKDMLHNYGLDALIEIDGGVTVENATSLKHAGASVLIAGNTVFGSSNPEQVIRDLKNA